MFSLSKAPLAIEVIWLCDRALRRAHVTTYAQHITAHLHPHTRANATYIVVTELRPVKAPLAIEVIWLKAKFLRCDRSRDDASLPPRAKRDVHVGDRTQTRKGAALDRGDLVALQIPASCSRDDERPADSPARTRHDEHRNITPARTPKRTPEQNATYSEVTEVRPVNAPLAIEAIWLLCKSLWRAVRTSMPPHTPRSIGIRKYNDPHTSERDVQ